MYTLSKLELCIAKTLSKSLKMKQITIVKFMLCENILKNSNKCISYVIMSYSVFFVELSICITDNEYSLYFFEKIVTFFNQYFILLRVNWLPPFLLKGGCEFILHSFTRYISYCCCNANTAIEDVNNKLKKLNLVNLRHWPVDFWEK